LQHLSHQGQNVEIVNKNEDIVPEGTQWKPITPQALKISLHAFEQKQSIII
jgi:hypothetical protein